MMKSCIILCFLLATMVGAQLPPKTYSQVCPAVSVDHRVDDATVYFLPNAPIFHQGFKFVDLHIQLQNENGEDSIPVRNYAMQKGKLKGKLAFAVVVADPDIANALTTGNGNVTYSFTYCVGINGNEVDCDTEAFQSGTYQFEYEVECPDACGLPPSKISPTLTCMKSDGSIAPRSQCSQLTKPIVECPATEACPRPLKACPAIPFRQEAFVKTPGKIEIYFVPTIQGAKRLRFDFINVHYQAKETPLLNHRMNVNKLNPVIGQKEGIEFGFVVSEPEVNALIGTGAQLEYSFTYCVELTDCDTQSFYLTL